MAGLYGFLAREPHSIEWVRERLALMRAQMTAAATDNYAEHAAESGGIGHIDPGAVESSIVYGGPSGRVFVAEGEVHHVAAANGSGSVCRHQAIWRSVYDRWIAKGPSTIEGLDGLYNGVEFDAGTPSLTLFNDRYGSRRLYCLDLSDCFVFASKLAPLAAWLGARAEVDRAFLEESICFGAAFGHGTWIRGVSLFPPATVMKISPERLQTCRYWKWSDVPAPGTHSAPDRFEALHERWMRAMTARLDGRRVGQQLSGGLDSRLILGEAVRQRPEWVTSTYGESESDDVRFARQAAEAAGAAWLHWPLPGKDWLDRRLALSVAHDGIVDIVNAHHAGLIDTLGGALDAELSGYLGDAVMGGTGQTQDSESLLDHVPYWSSPVSMAPADARARVEQSAAADTPWVWMMENKWRRATNGWPHMAADKLRVRKPFMDYALVEYCAGLPREDRRTRRAQRELLARFYPALARVPWQKTGVRPTAGQLAVYGMKAVRTAYRQWQPVAAAAGFQSSPWIRNAVDVSRWCQAPEIRNSIADCLMNPGAEIAGFYGREAIGRTLSGAFGRHDVAIEVPMNLLRAEHMLRRLREWRTKGASA